MIKVVRVTDDRRKYLGKDGEEHASSNLYAEININGNVRRFLIKTVFDRDRSLLDLAVDQFVHLDISGQPITKDTPSKK